MTIWSWNRNWNERILEAVNRIKWTLSTVMLFSGHAKPASCQGLFIQKWISSLADRAGQSRILSFFLLSLWNSEIEILKTNADFKFQYWTVQAELLFYGIQSSFYSSKKDVSVASVIVPGW